MKNILLFLLLPLVGSTQTLPDSTIEKIDNLFKSFSKTTPGCALAITMDGKIVLEKGYGMANLEYNIPIQPSTVFHIASESKQYVAFCMLLLEKEGKLSLDDDIRKYLDYVPDFGKKITIRHLIHHTSGIRDQWQLLANAGWQLDDVITLEHVTKLVSKQTALNFPPGEEFMYCNTGYTLMGEIVKKVSGLTLRQFADKNIFKPLGMTNTHFHDDYQELVPNRAYSYSPRGGQGYQHAVLSYSIVGATSLLTTVTDETKWLNNYETGSVGGKELIEKMYQVGVLNDGRKLNYAFAINIDKFKGWKEIAHGGGDAGFRTFAVRYPEKNIGIVVFSNSAITNPGGLTNQVAEVLIREPKKEDKAPEVVKETIDSSLIKKLQGRYISERGDLLELLWQNGKFMRKLPNNSNLIELKFNDAGNNRYPHELGYPVMIIDQKNKAADSIKELRMESQTNMLVFTRQPAVSQKITNEFAGKYVSGETEAIYTVTENNGQLTLNHRKFPNVPLKYIADDQFTCQHWWMSHIKFLRDKQGRIVAFEVNSGRILHQRHDKVATNSK